MDAQRFDLNDELMSFRSSDGSTPFLLEDATMGTVIFGANGAGKSSGSLKFMAQKYLAYGMGGLILTVKDDAKMWINLLRETNRIDDLILVEPGNEGNYHFDFLGYEAVQHRGGKAISENLAEIIETVIESNSEKSKGHSSDPFWQESLHQLIIFTLDLQILAYNTVSVRGLYDLALSVPKSNHKEASSPKPGTFDHAFRAARQKVEKQVKEFVKTLSEAQKAKLVDDDDFDRLVIENIPDAALFRSLDQYFNDHFKNLAEKTKSVITLSFTGFLFPLLREPIYSLFCRQSWNFTPGDSRKGKIILLNIPTKLYYRAGRSIQVAFKVIWQRAMERSSPQDNLRPAFLICDEAHELLHPHDVSFQSTSRSQKICTLYASQNLSSFYGNMGGVKSEHKVAALMGVFGTKVFHNNTHVETNNWASDLIGSAYVEDETRSTTMAGQFSFTHGTSYKLEKMVRPEDFNLLRTGGERNNFWVDAIIHRQNNPFHDRLSFRKVTFKQI